MLPPGVGGPAHPAYGQGHPQGMGGQQFMPGPAVKGAPQGGAQQPFSLMNPWSMLSSVSQMGALLLVLRSSDSEVQVNLRGTAGEAAAYQFCC